MKQLFGLLPLIIFILTTNAQTSNHTPEKAGHLFMDVHYLGAGKATAKDVAAAHAKDLEVQGQYGVQFLKYWVDEKGGIVYCLSSAADTNSIKNTHRDAHGLLPQEVHEVSDGIGALSKDGKTYFLDIHQLGAGKVTAADVARAHEKDLAVQARYGVNFINYWVDEKSGVVYCLSQATDSSKVIQTHQEAHGLLPASIVPVKQGQ